MRSRFCCWRLPRMRALVCSRTSRVRHRRRAPARAADLVEPDGVSSGGELRRSGLRAAPVVIYDYEPGVIVARLLALALASPPLFPAHRPAAAGRPPRRSFRHRQPCRNRRRPSIAPGRPTTCFRIECRASVFARARSTMKACRSCRTVAAGTGEAMTTVIKNRASPLPSRSPPPRWQLAPRRKPIASPYGQAPLYPYAAPPQQPYAVEVAPDTYVIQRPAPSRALSLCARCKTLPITQA